MLTVFRLCFAALCLAKSVDIAWRGQAAIGLMPSLTIAGLWAIASVSIAAGYRVKIASGLIIALAAVITVASRLEMYNQHLYLIASICAILIIGRSTSTLLKAQLSIAYGFAAITKLNEAFLSGTVIYVSAIQRPFWDRFIGIEPPSTLLIAVSVFAIATEAFLAVAFWFPRARWVALIIGVGFHMGMLVAMTEGPSSLLRLAVFGFLMIILYIPFFEREVDRIWGRFARNRPQAQSLERAPA